ncbi:MAG: hypothetical protein P8Y42_03665 [Exilibacterium sp.]
MRERSRYFMMTSLILLVAVVGVSWQWYQAGIRERQLQKQLLEMQGQVAQLQEQVGQLQTELNSLNKTSFKGLVRDANDAILSGWESLLDTVENEVKKAREALDQEQNPGSPQPGEPQPQTEPELDNQQHPQQHPQQQPQQQPQTIPPKTTRRT